MVKSLDQRRPYLTHDEQQELSTDLLKASHFTTPNASVATTQKMPKSTSSPLTELVNLLTNDRRSNLSIQGMLVLTSQECLQMLTEKKERKKNI